jgi:hypothetical protein
MPYFKVLVVDLTHGVYMVSSDEASWSYTSNYFWDDLAFLLEESNNVVVCRGTAHWLGCCFPSVSGLRTINVDAETGIVSVTKLETNPGQHGFRHYPSAACLSLDGDNTLSVIWMQMNHLKMEIWKQQSYKEAIDEYDDGTSIMHCSRVVELKMPQEIEMQGRVSHILEEKYGMLIVSYGEQVYTVHLETGIMEEVTGWPWHTASHWKTQPFEMDWLEFFLSRLGGR